MASEESSGAAKAGMMGGKGGISGRDSPMTRGRASPAPAGKPSAAVGTAAMRKGAKEKEEDKWEDF